MKPSDPKERRLHTAREDAANATPVIETEQTRAPSYRLAFQDNEFLLREDLRPVRLQLELLKPELVLQEHRIEQTIVIFGSARLGSPDEAAARLEAARAAAAAQPGDKALARQVKIAERRQALSRHYDEARAFARLVSESRLAGDSRYVIVTGGGPGLMEAANRGAADVGAPSVGHNIVLPHEQAPNPYVSPDLCFNFHYFALRKMHLLTRARAMVAFPGGFGTMDELFETLCLIQTGKSRPMPVLLFDRQYWESVLNFEALVDNGVIDAGDLALFRFVESAAEAWDVIRAHYEQS